MRLRIWCGSTLFPCSNQQFRESNSQCKSISKKTVKGKMQTKLIQQLITVLRKIYKIKRKLYTHMLNGDRCERGGVAKVLVSVWGVCVSQSSRPIHILLQLLKLLLSIARRVHSLEHWCNCTSIPHSVRPADKAACFSIPVFTFTIFTFIFTVAGWARGC